MNWQVGDRAKVKLPSAKGPVYLAGVIERIVEVGPSEDHPERTHRIAFDDPSVFGGMGKAWFDPADLVEDDGDPDSTAS